MKDENRFTFEFYKIFAFDLCKCYNIFINYLLEVTKKYKESKYLFFMNKLFKN